jgi:hypothetical protein
MFLSSTPTLSLSLSFSNWIIGGTSFAFGQFPKEALAQHFQSSLECFWKSNFVVESEKVEEC